MSTSDYFLQFQLALDNGAYNNLDVYLLRARHAYRPAYSSHEAVLTAKQSYPPAPGRLFNCWPTRGDSCSSTRSGVFI